ncbi:MAG: YXWGXW repeat-containing protein [Thermoanaerobaculia bacterium]
MSKKHGVRLFLAAVVASIPLLAGCVSYGYASYGPPADEVEVYGVAPGPDFVWVGGHHIWRGGGYTWQKGRWEKPPRRNAHWTKGAWQHSNRGWRYRDGRWN